MIKIIKKFLLLTICLFFIGCDNNEGPFEKKQVDGLIEVLYSDGRPAKGWVEHMNYNPDGTLRKVSEVEYNNGLPSGKFKKYDVAGKLVMDADLKLIESDKYTGKLTYEGEIIVPIYKSKVKGVFKFSPDWVGEDIEDFAIKISTLGEIEKISIDTEMSGRIETNFKNHQRVGEIKQYYENGKLFFSCIQSDEIYYGSFGEVLNKIKFTIYNEDGELIDPSHLNLYDENGKIVENITFEDFIDETSRGGNEEFYKFLMKHDFDLLFTNLFDDTYENRYIKSCLKTE